MANEKRLIDANALKRLTCEWCNRTRPEEPCEPSECSIMWFYDGQPIVDAVEVVHGRWIQSEPGYRLCSHCMADVAIYSGHINYCPNCGAKMDKNENM